MNPKELTPEEKYTIGSLCYHDGKCSTDLATQFQISASTVRWYASKVRNNQKFHKIEGRPPVIDDLREAELISYLKIKRIFMSKDDFKQKVNEMVDLTCESRGLRRTHQNVSRNTYNRLEKKLKQKIRDEVLIQEDIARRKVETELQKGLSDAEKKVDEAKERAKIARILTKQAIKVAKAEERTKQLARKREYNKNQIRLKKQKLSTY